MGILIRPLDFEEFIFFIISMTSSSETGSRKIELFGLFFKNEEKLTFVLGIISLTELPIISEKGIETFRNI